MPLPTALAITLATGVLAAWAGRAEVKLSPKHPLATRSFGAYLLFVVLLLLPVSVFFYVFHGDWFLLYTLEAAAIPSAVALIAFVFQGLVGVLGFAAASAALRAQREAAVLGLGLGAAIVGVLVPLMFVGRLGWVGSFAQFHNEYGLRAFSDTPLLVGAVGMNAFVLLGFGFLVARIHFGEKR